MSEENHIVPLTDIYQYQSNTGLVIPDTSNVQSQVIEGQDADGHCDTSQTWSQDSAEG